MMNLKLEDDEFAVNFFPFTQTRSIADLRCGILTIREKWDLLLQKLKEPINPGVIPGNIIPDENLIANLQKGKPKEIWNEKVKRLTDITDILFINPSEIKSDYLLITKNRDSAPVSDTNRISGSDIFLEPGAKMEHCIINALDGPVYIGKNALVMEGSIIRGPFALGEAGTVKMGTKIYGATSIGPKSIVGGEIKNSVIFGFSNKAHDGYLGDSIIGNWCNLGAGCSNSNIKNSGGPVKIWNPQKKSFLKGGTKFGLVMGDYSRAAINTSFNTGTVIGVCCHVFGNGLTPTYLPSFSWGFSPLREYNFENAIDHISHWMQLKQRTISQHEIDQLKFIFEQKSEFE